MVPASPPPRSSKCPGVLPVTGHRLCAVPRLKVVGPGEIGDQPGVGGFCERGGVSRADRLLELS